MNKIKILFILAMFGGMSGMMTACHTSYLDYEEPKDAAYFTEKVGMRTITVRFPDWDKGEKIGASTRALVMGFPSDADREVRIELVDSLTTAIEGQDYELAKKLVIPAGKVETYSSIITWNRRKEGDKRSDTLSVGCRIVENEHFIPTLGSMLKIMYIRSEASRPMWWEGGERYLGPWSPGLMYRFFDQYASLKTTNPEVYSIIYAKKGEHWEQGYWPGELDYLLIKYIVAPLYYYYQEHPEPGVVAIPKPQYE